VTDSFREVGVYVSVRAELANESRVVQFAGSKTTKVIGFFCCRLSARRAIFKNIQRGKPLPLSLR